MSLTELMWVRVIACCINDVSFLICRWRHLTVLISKSTVHFFDVGLVMEPCCHSFAYYTLF